MSRIYIPQGIADALAYLQYYELFPKKENISYIFINLMGNL